jgi:hypothetical protein
MSSFDGLIKNVQTKLHNIFLKKANNNPGRPALLESAKIPWYVDLFSLSFIDL